MPSLVNGVVAGAGERLLKSGRSSRVMRRGSSGAAQRGLANSTLSQGGMAAEAMAFTPEAVDATASWSRSSAAPASRYGRAAVSARGNSTSAGFRPLRQKAPALSSAADATGTPTMTMLKAGIGGKGSFSNVSNRPLRPWPQDPNPSKPWAPPTLPKLVPSAHKMKANEPLAPWNMTSEMMGAGVMMGAAAGAVGGAYYGNDGTAGGMISGALKGGFWGGAGGLALGAGAPAAVRAMANNTKFMSVAGSHSSRMVQLSNMMQTTEARNALFSGGGLLAGGYFGSPGKDKRRGFNSRRGSQVSSVGY